MLLNRHLRPEDVPPPSDEARAFHRSLPGYRPTPVRDLPAVAAELGLAGVALKDESDRLGLPAFKVLGASWAIERALRERPGVHTLVAATAGNHGRAVAREAARRGLRARIFVPARSVPSRRAAIAAEGADVVVVEDSYDDALAESRHALGEPGVLELPDVGATGPAHWVIDGYATIFSEAAEQAEFDTILVPVGVGALGAAAARFGASAGVRVVAVEPETAACLTASLAEGAPAKVDTPGTAMAGLDAAEVSEAAWPSLRAGIHATVTVSEDEVGRAVAELGAAGLHIGHSGAAPLAALRRVAGELGADTRALLIATEGRTDL